MRDTTTPRTAPACTPFVDAVAELLEELIDTEVSGREGVIGWLWAERAILCLSNDSEWRPADRAAPIEDQTWNDFVTGWMRPVALLLGSEHPSIARVARTAREFVVDSKHVGDLGLADLWLSMFGGVLPREVIGEPLPYQSSWTTPADDREAESLLRQRKVVLGRLAEWLHERCQPLLEDVDPVRARSRPADGECVAWLKTGEAFDLFSQLGCRCSRDTIKEMARRDDIKGRKLPNGPNAHWRFCEWSIRDWCARHKPQQP